MFSKMETSHGKQDTRIHVDLPKINFVEVENDKMATNWLLK